MKDATLPAVTIVIPLYNAEEYFSELKSSLEQQSMHEFSVIIVNDGSTDASGKLAEQWADSDPRVICLSQENQGLSGARNRALDYLAGNEEVPEKNIDTHRAPYLLFVDSDDKLDPVALEHLLHQANKDSLDILFYSGSSFFQTSTIETAFAHYKDYYNRNAALEGVYSGLDFATAVVASADFKPSVCLQFFSTAFLLKNSLRFFDGILNEDNLFTFSCLLAAKRTAFLNENLYLRRVREDSIMTKPLTWKNVEGYLRCGIEALKILEHYPHEQVSARQAEAIAALINSFFNSAMGNYLAISEDERARLIQQFLAQDSAIDHVIFEQTIRQPALRMADASALATSSAAVTIRDEYENSTSYRIGRALTKLPRALLRRE